MTFKKGQSGNPGGRSSDKLFRESLMLSLKEAHGDLQKMRRVTDALVAKAVEGNVHAIALIADRIDGKVGSDAASPEDEREAIFGRSVSAAQRIIARITASRPNTEDRDAHKRRLGLLFNPVNTEDVKRPAVNDERAVRLSMGEREALLQSCDDARNPWLRAFVELGFETGARRGNLLRLEWNDVDLQRKTALLRGIKNSRSPEKIVNHIIGLTAARGRNPENAAPYGQPGVPHDRECVPPRIQQGADQGPCAAFPFSRHTP